MAEPVKELDLLLGERRWLDDLARSLVRDRGVAEELAQDAWTRVLERPARLTHGDLEPRTVRAYLGRIVRNLAHDRRRTDEHRGERERVAARPEAQPGADELALRFELHKRVVECVHALEEPYRSAILLRWFEGLPPRAIGRRLGVPVKTVNTRLDRALAILRARLDRDFGGDRRAWALLFARAFDSGSAATAGGTVLVAAKVQVALVALVVAAAVAWWWTQDSQDGARANALATNAPALEPPSAAPRAVSVTDAQQPKEPTPDAPRASAALVHPRPTVPHLTVRVIDLTEAPRAGVLVTIGHNPVQGSDIPEREVRDARELVQTKETGTDGFVYFEVPPRREFEALAALADCVPLRAEHLVAGMEHVFRLGAPASVSGQVTWLDSGAPVEGALVAPAFDAYRERYGVRTDANGAYVLRGLAAPKVVLYLFPPQGAPIVVGVDLVEGGEVVRTFAAGRGRRASGFVRDARTGKGIAGAVIDIPSQQNLPRSVTGDATGAYTFAGIVSGSMATLRARAPGYGTLAQLAPNDDESPQLDFDLEPERVIRGRILDTDRRPLAGVFAAAERINSKLPLLITTLEWSVTRTNPDGRFVLAGLNVRDAQRVLAYGEGRGACSVELTPDELARNDVDLGELVLAASGSIAGRVLDEFGAPIANATITAQLARDDHAPADGIVREKTLVRTAKTNESGAYVLLDVPPGRLGLRVEVPQRIPPVPFTVEVPAGAELVDIDVRLAPTVSIRGVVLGPDGGPLANADVRVQNEWSSARAMGKSWADGRFEVGGLQPGTYTVWASQDLGGAGKPGRVEMQQAVARDIAAGAVDLELRLRRIVYAKGRVLDARGEPLAHAVVIARRATGGFESTVSTNEQGRFVLRCIEKELHHVLVERTEPDPDRTRGRRVEPPGFIDLELDWTCDTEHELVLRVPDRPR
ncbi:MAG: sigma-70 family RNA polymerase sigma factor [Planctomycetes bacterium]|nr:sigma-70 family RNA polymerase sigma factor [Planctomycetota bacterium]